MNSDILIVGYGNALRCDDGVGVRLVEALTERLDSHVRCLTATQLTPEVAAEVSECRAALFIDASVDPDVPQIRLRQVEPVYAPSAWSHTFSVASLLAFCQAVYGRVPPAWLLSIPVVNLELGDRLSASAVQAMIEANDLVERWIKALPEEGYDSEKLPCTN